MISQINNAYMGGAEITQVRVDASTPGLFRLHCESEFTEVGVCVSGHSNKHIKSIFGGKLPISAET